MSENLLNEVLVDEKPKMQNLSVKERVNKIVIKRQSLRKEYKATHEKIQQWVELRNNIYAFKSNSMWIKLINTTPNLETCWHDLLLRTDDFSQKLNLLTTDKQTGDFDEAFARVGRSWLNLGLVGPWRYGKSITIAKLTGLDSYIVPLSQYGKCTGTTIDIINGKDINATKNLDDKTLLNTNGADIKSDNNKANIYFYSLNKMCQLMNEYIQKVGKPFIFNECTTTDAFEAECKRIKTLIEYQSPVNEENIERYNIFREYIEHACDYSRHLTGKIGVITELTRNKELYRPFVSFLAKPDEEYNLNGNETPQIIYKVLAVEHVEVYTNFRLCGEEVGEIHIVDNPGYGEARLGVYEALENALKKELDIAIDLFKTTVGIEPTLAQEFHKLLLKCVNERNAQDWLFYLFNLSGINRQDYNPLISATREGILNHLNTPFYNNKQRIEGIHLSYDLDELLKEGISGHVAQIDCQHEPQMLQKFFYQILDIMSSTIVNVDEAFFTKVKSQIKETEIAYSSVLEKISGIDKYLPKDKRNHVREHLNNIYRSINNIIPSDINTDLEPISKPICDLCNNKNKSILLGILSKGTIKEFPSDTTGKLLKENEEEDTIDFKIDYTKQVITTSISENDYISHIEFTKYELIKKDLYKEYSKAFCEIINNSNINYSISSLKTKIINIFIKEGRLNFISDNEENWLSHFIQILEMGGNIYTSLFIPFKKFEKCKITIEETVIGNINTSINNCLFANHFSTSYFDDYDSICYEFAHSLYNIESEIKQRLHYDFNDFKQIQKFLSPANDEFYKPIRDFVDLIFAIGIPAGMPHPEYDALIQFFLDNFDKIADPEFKLLQRVISDWDSKINFHKTK
ncbi:MAG: hypothetical protein HXX16_02450 [Bacteroidales bacterium]|nr:hypothetical protein [Bacteroidales bacterium]